MYYYWLGFHNCIIIYVSSRLYCTCHSSKIISLYNTTPNQDKVVAGLIHYVCFFLSWQWLLIQKQLTVLTFFLCSSIQTIYYAKDNDTSLLPAVFYFVYYYYKVVLHVISLTGYKYVQRTLLHGVLVFCSTFIDTPTDTDRRTHSHSLIDRIYLSFRYEKEVKNCYANILNVWWYP